MYLVLASYGMLSGSLSIYFSTHYTFQISYAVMIFTFLVLKTETRFQAGAVFCIIVGVTPFTIASGNDGKSSTSPYSL